MNDLTQIVEQSLHIVFVYFHSYCVHRQMTTAYCTSSLRMFITLQYGREITLTPPLMLMMHINY